MEHKLQAWRTIWTDPQASREDLCKGMQLLLQHARGHPISELEDDCIMRVVSRMAPNKARGVDVLSPIDIQRLPTEGQQQFGDVLREAERVGSRPVQLLLAGPRLLERLCRGPS
ncbi:unnamed protein product [Prorocentrum cordatum]|uniref:Uncharacterized protein n=1 Tax=Prorocentrum cordatum TaxID=2364126 RepID=A0ABN9T852_9DINO|nr:unnamed protein product [Polarella glacialis]